MCGRTAVLSLTCLALVLCAPAAAKIHKFDPKQPGTRNLGVWRLTFDPARRDSANYHNIQCWSHDGRYTVYTHDGGDEGPGGKASMEIHVVDLSTGEARFVGKGMAPRWANNHNWLFYCHWTRNGKPPYETGTQIIRYNLDTGERVVITHGMEGPTSLDSSDTWLYGVQRYRGRKPQMVTVRVLNKPHSRLELIKGAPNTHGYIHVNPRHPVIMTRAKQPKDKVYGRNRGFFDLDGSNLRKGNIMAEGGHATWSGDGKYLLLGNKQVCGRPWNKPYPSDLVMLAYGGLGDICPCDKAGRYICGGNLTFVDTRSGDQWTVVRPYSYIIFTMKGDNSSLIDIDPKGSPDGTKIHYHSTRNIEHLPVARITKYEPDKAGGVIHVDSTKGFPESGDVVSRWEVIDYSKKTPTTFEGITRQTLGTRKTLGRLGGRKANILFPLSSYLLIGEQRKRARPNATMVRGGKLPLTHPLVWQRQTDCYVVVTRLPFPPHLRMTGAWVELIPGENHWETRGYRILRNGKPVSTRLVKPGDKFSLPGPGAYTAVAVEWSGLESPPSAPLSAAVRIRGRVLKEKPGDFSWTREAWKVRGKAVSSSAAVKAPEAEMEVVHRHDGVIAREEWRNGARVSRVDLNREGKPIRHQWFEKGARSKQVYRSPEGRLASVELFGPDGFKTEYIRYHTDPLRGGRVYEHWWYARGRAVKRIKRGSVLFHVRGNSKAAGKSAK